MGKLADIDGGAFVSRGYLQTLMGGFCAGGKLADIDGVAFVPRGNIETLVGWLLCLGDASRHL